MEENTNAVRNMALNYRRTNNVALAWFHDLGSFGNRENSQMSHANLQPNGSLPEYYADNISRNNPPSFLYNQRHSSLFEGYSSSSAPIDDNGSFPFIGTQYVTFDLDRDNLTTIIDKIKLHKGYNFSFDTTHTKGQYYATGKGATKHVYNKLFEEITSTIMTVIHPQFIDVNTQHRFWLHDENIECFVRLIAMIIKSNYVLPYHFAPGLLESICGKSLSKSELEFFIDKIDPETYQLVSKINANDFESIDLDFESHEEYYRDTIIGKVTTEKLAIYKSISHHFEIFDAFGHYDCISIDEKFSGAYSLTAEKVLSIMNFTEAEYLPMWKKFVCTLSELDLRKMLIAFGNTISLQNEYIINVHDDVVLYENFPKKIMPDIKITSCFHIVSIHRRLFEKQEYLNNLKSYFDAGDTISDGTQLINVEASPLQRPAQFHPREEITMPNWDDLPPLEDDEEYSSDGIVTYSSQIPETAPLDTTTNNSQIVALSATPFRNPNLMDQIINYISLSIIMPNQIRTSIPYRPNLLACYFDGDESINWYRYQEVLMLQDLGRCRHRFPDQTFPQSNRARKRKENIGTIKRAFSPDNAITDKKIRAKHNRKKINTNAMKRSNKNINYRISNKPNGKKGHR